MELPSVNDCVVRIVEFLSDKDAKAVFVTCRRLRGLLGKPMLKRDIELRLAWIRRLLFVPVEHILITRRLVPLQYQFQVPFANTHLLVEATHAKMCVRSYNRFTLHGIVYYQYLDSTGHWYMRLDDVFMRFYLWTLISCSEYSGFAFYTFLKERADRFAIPPKHFEDVHREIIKWLRSRLSSHSPLLGAAHGV